VSLYARSDIKHFVNNDGNCPTHGHRVRKDDERLVIDCPECEPRAWRLKQAGKRLFSDSLADLPLTREEQAAKDEADREVQLALAAEQRDLRAEAHRRAQELAAQRPRASRPK
jgi:hypothetical protein